MTPKDMIAELLNCYVLPPAAVQSKMEQLAATIPENARKDVIDRILETEASSTKISIKHIIEACNTLGVSYKAAKYVPAINWICDACGREFLYHQAPTDDDKIDKQIYDFCPDCGMQPGWTILMQKYKAFGIATPWYDRLLADCAKAYGPKVKAHVDHIGAAGMGMNLNRGGIFWSRLKAENERTDAEAEKKKIAIADKLSAIDKRWDIERSGD
jgi:hypothetical protein